MVTLVTGATGFIGRHVAERLAEQGGRVKVLCRSEAKLSPILRAHPQVEVAIGDMCDKASLERAMSGVTHVIHLAAATSGSEEYFQATTVQGTSDLLAIARRGGVQRFVHVSSMSVYDYSKVPAGGVVDEETPLETQLSLRNDYARAKSQAEAIARESMQRGDLPIAIVRPGAVYGPGGKTFILSALVRRGGVSFLIGGGRRQIPMIYVENLVDALLLTLEHDAAVGRIYNLVDADPPSEYQYLRALCEIEKNKQILLPLPGWPFLIAAHLAQAYRDRRGASGGMHLVHGFRRVIGHVRFTADAARRDLGWKSRVPLREGMRATYGDAHSPRPSVLGWGAGSGSV